MEVGTLPTTRRESSTTPERRDKRPKHHERRPTTTHERKGKQGKEGQTKAKRRKVDPSFLLLWNGAADLRLSFRETLPPVSFFLSSLGRDEATPTQLRLTHLDNQPQS